MSFKSVLVVSNSPLTGDPGEFVGRYGYTRFYGPIPSSRVTTELLGMLPGVDIFWMSTSSLSDPVYFTNFEAPEYGNRRMWIVKPDLEWSFPTELTSLIGSYLDKREIQKLAEGVPDVGGPMMASLLRRYRPWWNKLLESYDEKMVGTIDKFMDLHPDPKSAYEAMSDYLKIMTGPTRSERINEAIRAKGLDVELIDVEAYLDLEGDEDIIYPVNWRLLGETLPLEMIRGLLLHIYHPLYNRTDTIGMGTLINCRFEGIPLERKISDPHDEQIYLMILGALDSENPKMDVVLYLSRILIDNAPEIVSLALAKGHTEIAEQLLEIRICTDVTGDLSLREILERMQPR